MERLLFKWLALLMTASLVPLSVSPVFAAKEKKAKKTDCIVCHEKVTPGIVKQFLTGKMGKKLDCSSCHGSAHKSASDVANVKLPTPETCATCHAARVKEYRAGKHALAFLHEPLHQVAFVGAAAAPGGSNVDQSCARRRRVVVQEVPTLDGFHGVKMPP